MGVMTLAKFIENGLTHIGEIATYMDALDHRSRLKEIHRLNPRAMAMLYERAADAPPLALEHFVPRDRPALTRVTHHGWNSLPAFRRFQKPCCRPVDDNGDRLFGYNEGFTRPFVGPGYFVIHPTEGTPHWERRGALVIDYFLEPDGPVAPDFPRLRPNCQGLARLVYFQTRDFMRRISHHVSIGAAYKIEQPLNVYFILCRED